MSGVWGCVPQAGERGRKHARPKCPGHVSISPWHDAHVACGVVVPMRASCVPPAMGSPCESYVSGRTTSHTDAASVSAGDTSENCTCSTSASGADENSRSRTAPCIWVPGLVLVA